MTAPRSRSHADVDPPAWACALLARLETTERKIDALVAQIGELLDRQAADTLRGISDADIGLAEAIDGVTKGAPFKTFDLLEATTLPAGELVREALQAAIGSADDGRRIGAWLSKHERAGSNLDRLRVHRVGESGGTATWQVVVSGG